MSAASPVEPGDPRSSDSPRSNNGRGEAPPLLSMQEMTRVFGAVRALTGANFELEAGEVHALLGPNGAGKSTLVKVLAGVHQPDSGHLLIRGAPMTFSGASASQEAGVAIVYQELSLVPSLSIAENILLGREPRTRGGLVRRAQLRSAARELCGQVGLEIDVDRRVETLPFAQRQLVEIAKALSLEAGIFVFDEPTSSLTPVEKDQLFQRIRTLTARGVGVIYITHRLDEVFELSDRVTIMRDGRDVGTYATVETDLEQVVAGIVGDRSPVAVGTDPAEPDLRRPARRPGAVPVLRVEGLAGGKIRDVSFEVHAGEVVGLAGLIGSGRSEILRAIFGIDPMTNGAVYVDGERVEVAGPAAAIAHGLALVPEDRHEEGLILDHTILANVVLPRLGAFRRRLGLRRDGEMSKQTTAAMQRLGVKAPSARTPVSSLSGGNQQKVVFAKWLGVRPRVLMLDEPMVGVDVGAKDEIGAVVRRQAEEGMAVVMVSSELGELLQMCDRIIVVADGTVTTAVDRDALATEDELHSLVQGTRMARSA